MESVSDRNHTKGSICIVTLGCAKNEVDSAEMASLLAKAGYLVSTEPEGADAVILNTCSFIRSAVEEGIDEIFDILDDDYVASHNIPLIITGCMPSRYGSDLESELPEVAAFVPCKDEANIVEVVSACTGRDQAAKAEERAACLSNSDDFWQQSHEGLFAYVKISDGCDRWCSYCTIPLIRGRYKSFPLDEINAQVDRHIRSGIREIVLIGQDTGLWGSDFDEPSSLACLLKTLASRYPNTWFRAMYTQPENVTDELLEAMASYPNICPYLDIPMQHVNSRLLSAMNRKGSHEELSELVAHIRQTVPDVAIRTTLIAGFPGETEAMHEELLGFVEEEAFDYVGVFPYSREEGTRAYDLPDQLEEEEKAYRAERLRTVADAISSHVIAERIGHTMPVLIEGREEDGQMYGRAQIQAPEVDGITYVDAGNPGEVRIVEMDGTLMYDMEGIAS